MSSSSSTPAPTSLLNHYQHVQDVDQSIFLALQVVGGQILLPILVLTILVSKRIKRNIVFINFCVSWIVSSVVYSLLVYRGRSSDDVLTLSPSPGICLVQASLINGVQALTSISYLSLAAYLWVVLNGFGADNPGKPSVYQRLLSHEILFPSLLVAIPYVSFAFCTIISVVIGNQKAIDEMTGQLLPGSNLSIPRVFYCIILQNGNFSVSISSGLNLWRAFYFFSVIITFINLVVEILIALSVYKKRFIQQARVRVHNNTWTALITRIVAFSIYRILALGLNLALVLQPDELLLIGISRKAIFNGMIDLVQAAIPIVAFLIFATEKDILDVWTFWKGKKFSAETSGCRRLLENTVAETSA